jgi:ABC-type ATPase involved in cell division
VDVQLEEFEEDLATSLDIQLILNMDVAYWREMDHISAQDRQGIRRVIDEALVDLMHRYSAVPPIIAILEHCRILIMNVVWASMDVPCPNLTDLHAVRVIENAMEVYNENIYAPLRTEMIMANHNAEVLQRTWRRCITDPSHTACRRRLEYEFNDALRDLNTL